jgi:trans-aconitate 2-methyltransferase
MWDPKAYQRYGDERSRPFYELVGRVRAVAPDLIVDLGCGPGNLTATLADRWPQARIQGLDSSPEMIRAANEQAPTWSEKVTFATADARDWTPPPGLGVLVANAVLQWVPGHRELLAGWVDRLQPDAWVAFQVPGNFEVAAHRLLYELAASPHWTAVLGRLFADGRMVWDPADYTDDLLGQGCDVDAWETTYVHLLPVEDGRPHPVLAWMEGTALRPVKAALAAKPDGDRLWDEFRDQLAARLAVAYAPRHGMVAFPFRRVFVVARKR